MEYTYTKNNIKITNIKKLNFIYFIYNIYIYITLYITLIYFIIGILKT